MKNNEKNIVDPHPMYSQNELLLHTESISLVAICERNFKDGVQGRPHSVDFSEAFARRNAAYTYCRDTCASVMVCSHAVSNSSHVHFCHSSLSAASSLRAGNIEIRP